MTQHCKCPLDITSPGCCLCHAPDFQLLEVVLHEAIYEWRVLKGFFVQAIFNQRLTAEPVSWIKAYLLLQDSSRKCISGPKKHGVICARSSPIETIRRSAGGVGGFSAAQVEEVRMVMRMLPIFFTTILFWTIYCQVSPQLSHVLLCIPSIRTVL